MKVRSRITCRTTHVVYPLKCTCGFYYEGKKRIRKLGFPNTRVASEIGMRDLLQQTL